jgi:hypothetical protein
MTATYGVLAFILRPHNRNLNENIHPKIFTNLDFRSPPPPPNTPKWFLECRLPVYMHVRMDGCAPRYHFKG